MPIKFVFLTKLMRWSSVYLGVNYGGQSGPQIWSINVKPKEEEREAFTEASVSSRESLKRDSQPCKEVAFSLTHW